MDIIIIIFAFVLLLAGLAGSVLPVLPGPPLSWLGVVVFHFSGYGNFSWTFHLWMFAGMLIVTVLDYLIPIWGTKKFGGSRAGAIGSGIGLLVGLFFGPVGVIAGPFLGALIFELINDSTNPNKAFKSALGSFVGFLAGTGLKLLYGGIAIWYCVAAFF
jgi:uncharacterized protein YqgC (DUF456 family)